MEFTYRGTPGSKKGNPHCSMCCAIVARPAPGTLRIEDNRTAKERREEWGGVLWQLPAAPSGSPATLPQ